MNPARRMRAALAVLAVALIGCSQSSGSPTSGAGQSTTPASTTTPASSVEPSVGTTSQPAAASPVQIATAFAEAYRSYDADGAASYLTDDALQEFAGDMGGLRLQLRQAEAAGFTYLLDTCEEQDSSPPGTSVRCTYDYHGIRSDEIGLGPYSGSWFDITVLEGEIVSVSDHIVFLENGFSDQMWEPFAAWVEKTYPEDGAIMYENWPSIFMAQFTDESIELWEQRSREYVEFVISEDPYFTSGNAYRVRALEICTANKARQVEAWEAAEVEKIDVEDMPGENILVTAVMMEIAIPILEEGLAELRLVPPPEAVRARFEYDYLLLEQEIEHLRRLVVGVESPPMEPAAHRIQSSLEGCTIGG